MAREWRSFGDVNFLEHGGTMVRHAWTPEELEEYPSLVNDFEVFMLEPSQEHENCVLAALKRVDTDDYSLRDRMELFNETGRMPADEFEWASEFASKSGFGDPADTTWKSKGMYSSLEDCFITREEAAEWMKELGIGEEEAWI